MSLNETASSGGSSAPSPRTGASGSRQTRVSFSICPRPCRSTASRVCSTSISRSTDASCTSATPISTGHQSSPSTTSPAAAQQMRTPAASCCAFHNRPATTTAAASPSAPTASSTSASATAAVAAIRMATVRTPTPCSGTILRIDPVATETAAYLIPDGNPFAFDGGGAPEIFLYGVRNPWRFSFDLPTGDMWIADVGQNAFEEINQLTVVDGFRSRRKSWLEPLGGVRPL